MKDPASNGGIYSETKLGDAKGDEQTRRRCGAILETMAPSRVKRSGRGGDYYIKLTPGGGAWWVLLGPWYNNSITVRIYPGNTVRQAREFFKRVSKQEFLGLESKGWEIQPYLCFCFMAWGPPAYGKMKARLEQYFDYWASEEIRQIRREDNGFEDLSQRLRALHMIDTRGRNIIKKDFIETKRDFMNVCPGFELIFAWRRAEANRLDRNQGLVEAFRDRANEALGTWDRPSRSARCRLPSAYS